MGICETKKNISKSDVIEPHLIVGNSPVPLKSTIELSKSICRIINKNIIPTKFGTGFFMNYKNLKLLISNYQVISSNLINKSIEIEINNKKKINLKLDKSNRYIRLFSPPIDISVIEIKDTDGINEDIVYLNYDLTLEKGYSEYKESEVIFIGYPLGKELVQGNGKIININKFQFDHNIPTEEGLLGSPIIFFKTSNVIGIHKDRNKANNTNMGTFIQTIFNEIDNDLNKDCTHDDEKNNYIFAEIDINEYDINQNIRIINLYEKQIEYNQKMEKYNCNEEEIKQCKIEINGYPIPFNYYHNFKDKGKYVIKYTFKNNLTKANYMFFQCCKFTKINLSNFNSKNVIDMSYMFSGCESLKEINLSNLNTQNVTNMKGIFDGCKSLQNIDLSYFNTQNVTNMSLMFRKCQSLTYLILNEFNTQNVTDMGGMFGLCSSLIGFELSSKFNTLNVTNMSYMFCGCESLTNIGLSNFNTINVTNMSNMFFACQSLSDINLSNFNTINVIDMSKMFGVCTKLTNLDLSNFNTITVTNMNNMFFGCESLTNINLSNFKTINVIDMSNMFAGCCKLTNLDLSNFNTTNVQYMKGMFLYCKSLSKINLSNFNTQKAINIYHMFYGCNSLKKENLITKDLKILQEYDKHH